MAQCRLPGRARAVTAQRELRGAFSALRALLACQGRHAVRKGKCDSVAQLELLAAAEKVRVLSALGTG